MSNSGPTQSKRGNSTTTIATTAQAGTGLLLLGTFVLVVGLTVAVAGGTAGASGSSGSSATTATAITDYEELLVTTGCEEPRDGVGANNLTVVNPNEDPVAVTLHWNETGDRSSIQVRTEVRGGAQTTQTQIQTFSAGDSQAETQILIRAQTHPRTELAAETERETTVDGTRTETTYNLTTTIGAAENVTVLGLPDETYELSATTDENEDVPIDHAEITIECDSDAETQSVET